MGFSPSLLFAQMFFAMPFIVSAFMFLGFFMVKMLYVGEKISDCVEGLLLKKKKKLNRHESWDEFWASLYILPYGKIENTNKWHIFFNKFKKVIINLLKELWEECIIELFHFFTIVCLICWPFSAIAMIFHLM